MDSRKEFSDSFVTYLMTTCFVAHGTKEKTFLAINHLKRMYMELVRNVITVSKRIILIFMSFWIFMSTPKLPTNYSTRFTTHMILRWTKECLPDTLPKVRHIVQKWICKLTNLSLLISTYVVMNISLITLKLPWPAY